MLLCICSSLWLYQKDKIDYQYCWKNQRMQDCYVEGHISVNDAKVATALCKGEAIMYEVKPEGNISESWILLHVVPNIASITAVHALFY